MRSATFIFPHVAAGPTGGYKVVYEYANRLAADGVEVHIVYAGSIFWRQKPLRFKISNTVRYVQTLVRGYSARRWFPLSKRVREHLTLSMCYRHMPKTDVYVATSPYTAHYLGEYPIADSRKFYFIQGKEDWGPGLKAILADTYHLPMQKIVVARWLKDMLRTEHSEDSILIPNGFDFEKFSMDVAPEQRDRHCVSMMYHTQELKRCGDAIEALKIAKGHVPELRVEVFGVPERPASLPEWFTYHRMPDAATHNRINNEAAIYVASSATEGWGLTIGEAMICGQAVCCTDNAGYREMAVDGDTALLSPIKNPEALAANIVRLMIDDELRLRIARRGHEDIRRFSWETSYRALREALHSV